MDLLDSILNGMEKPPSVKKPEIKDKEKREKYEKMKKQRVEAEKREKALMSDFRNKIMIKLRELISLPITDDPKSIKIETKPLSKIYRAIVHEACEEFQDDLVVHSIGEEEVDRHCVIWRKGFEPPDDELRAMKLGIEYKPKKADEDEDEEDRHNESDTAASTRSDGKDKFWSKYEKIIGENASGIESARIALPAEQYGFVPVANKKDQRSIEQTLDDIRRNKKQKTSAAKEDLSEPEQKRKDDN